MGGGYNLKSILYTVCTALPACRRESMETITRFSCGQLLRPLHFNILFHE